MIGEGGVCVVGLTNCVYVCMVGFYKLLVVLGIALFLEGNVC